jgi:galactose mutarotase-like enzyme
MGSYTIKSAENTAVIDSLGAELKSYSAVNTNYIWSIDENFWNKTSPLLFPIVGRLKNDFYTFDDTSYELPRHGFARNYNFEVIAQNENSILFSLKSNTATKIVYPFEFELQISYTLMGNALTITYTVLNNSLEKMPFSIGAHPAFAINADFNDYSLTFENDEQLHSHLLENELFSGEIKTIKLDNKSLPLNYSLFEKDAIVLKHFKSKWVTLNKLNIPILKINLGNFPHLGIWTKKDAPFLCIEPWHGYADSNTSTNAITDKEGIVSLNATTSFSTSFSIEIL